MPRKPLPPAEENGLTFTGKTPPEMAEQEIRALEKDTQREKDLRSLAADISYALPGDSLDPELIQRDIAVNARRSVETCLETGRGLIMLKAVCEHGDFVNRLDAMQFEQSLARRFMQAAQKFSKRATSHVLDQIGSQSKLLEMLVLDDEEVEELALTGQTGGLELDKIDTMSVTELRKTLRERRAEDEAKDRVSAGQRETIQELQTQLQRAAQEPPDVIDEDLREQASKRAWRVETDLRGQLRPVLQALKANAEVSGIDVRACIEGHLNQIDLALADIRRELGVIAGPTPEIDFDWSDAPPPGSPDTH